MVSTNRFDGSVQSLLPMVALGGSQGTGEWGGEILGFHL